MLKIKHPGSIVRDREKKVSDWETVRTYKYSNGVECQILIGFLPHGHAQSAITANREFTLAREGNDLLLEFSDKAAPLTDFASGARLTAEGPGVTVLDPCYFVPTAKVAVRQGGETAELQEEGGQLVASFGDGTKVTMQPHGGHAHVEAKRDGQTVKTFYNGKDNTLYVFGPLPAWATAHSHDHDHDHAH